MHLYKNCSDIPLHNFNVVYNTNDLKFLIVGYNGYDEVKPPKEANERWQEIKNEWVKLLGNATTAYYYQLLQETIYLQTRYNAVRSLLEQIFKRDDIQGAKLDEFTEGLALWKYKWQKGQTREKNLTRLLKQQKASENKIKIKVSELEEMKKEQGDDGDDVSIERQVLIIEQSTGIKINPRVDSVKTWVEACKIHEDIQNQRQKK